MKPMGKQVQVPEIVLADILRLAYFLEDYELDETTKSILQRLLAVVDDKIEARERREAFTAYKTATADGQEREEARQRYLDMVGMHKDWRSSKETRP